MVDILGQISGICLNHDQTCLIRYKGLATPCRARAFSTRRFFTALDSRSSEGPNQSKKHQLWRKEHVVQSHRIIQHQTNTNDLDPYWVVGELSGLSPLPIWLTGSQTSCLSTSTFTFMAGRQSPDSFMAPRQSHDSSTSSTNQSTNYFAAAGSPDTVRTELSGHDSPKRNTEALEGFRKAGVTIHCDHRWKLPPSTAPLVSAQTDSSSWNSYMPAGGKENLGYGEAVGDQAADDVVSELCKDVPESLVDRPATIPEGQKAIYKRAANLLQVSELTYSGVYLPDTVQSRGSGFLMAWKLPR